MNVMSITERTTISLSFVAALLGGASWMTVVWATGNSNSQSINEIKQSENDKWKVIEGIRHEVEDIHITVTRIDQKVRDERRSKR